MDDSVANLRVCMLGPIDVLIAEQTVELRGQHQRTLVGVLATEIGHVVPSSRLIDALWGEYPPMSARTKLQGCVSAVRKSLGSGDWPIITRGAGYVLTANGVTTDLGDHQALLRRAESELDRCHFAPASACFRDALDLWRGHAFADASSAVLTGIGNALELLRLLAIERKATCDLALRRNHVVASELALSLASNPLRESMRGMLMLALYRQGSRAQALATYREGRDILRDLVGIEPGPLLRELHTLMLNDDPMLITDSVTRMMADGLVDSNTLPAGTVDI